MDEEDDQLDLHFELINSDDLLLTTLTVRSNVPLTPEDFAAAIRAYADRIDVINTMADAGNVLH